MARYLVIHTPIDPEDTSVQTPTRMAELAKFASAAGASPRWLKCWSPDLNDDRLFSLWDAERGSEIERALEQFDFLTHMSMEALRVWEWGPEDILASGMSASDSSNE
ncbi:MAG: hypothetical protein M3R06_06000 [Chloroflexota bacterium]|nr:hypothetical protein [Chloroflexota bacterium]